MISLLLACQRAPEPPDPTCERNALVPAVLDCRWTSAEPGTGAIEFWLDDEEPRSTPLGATGTDHAVAVLGLKAGRTYRYRAVTQVDGARVESSVRDYTAAEVPADFPAFTVEAYDPDQSELDPYVMLSVAVMSGEGFSVVAILDLDGDYVWWTRSEDRKLAIAPKFSRDGESVWFLATDLRWEEDVGTIHRVALDGSSSSATRALLGHHAMVENVDGALTWIGFEYRTVAGVDWASDALRTAPEGSDDATVPVREFSWFDAYGMDPWDSDPGSSDVSLGDATEWTHTNSLMALDDASFYLMSRRLDALLKVDRASGAVEWQLGGEYGDFTHSDGRSVWRSLVDNDLFSHSHMSHLWDGGMVVFDNGEYHDPKVSRAVEYAFDEQARTVEEVWHYDEPDRGYTGSMGDVRKLPGGNYLVAWNSLQYLNEVTPGGETVWKARMSDVGSLGRVMPLADLYAPPAP